MHTTQFAIRDAQVGLFAPVLQLAIETVKSFELEKSRRLVRLPESAVPLRRRSKRRLSR